MNQNNIIEMTTQETHLDPLTELIRKAAQDLLRAGIEAEVIELLEGFAHIKTPENRAGVVRNGYHPEREVQSGVGPITVKIPKVRSKTGQPVTFRSALVPPYVRKTQTLQSAIPWLYLKDPNYG